jgi:hypothetical protein
MVSGLIEKWNRHKLYTTLAMKRTFLNTGTSDNIKILKNKIKGTLEVNKELKIFWYAIRSHMTNETPFKNLHQPEGFKSIMIQIMNNWMILNRKFEKNKNQNSDMYAINLYFW